MTKSGAPKRTTSLADFALAKRRAARRAACAVCALPDKIREQTKTARDKKIDVSTVLEWLAASGYKIGESVYLAHGSGHHDREIGDAA